MSETTASSMGPTDHEPAWGRWLLATLIVVGLWITAYYAARMLEYGPFASLWYPPAAVSFAAFAVFRWRALPALILANLLGAVATFHREGMMPLLFGQMLTDGLLFALTHCAGYWLAAEHMLLSIPYPRAWT